MKRGEEQKGRKEDRGMEKMYRMKEKRERNREETITEERSDNHGDN